MFSDTNLLFVSVWPTVLLALSVVLVLAEYLLAKKRRWIFTVVSAVFLAACCAVLLWQGCSLCDLLVLICVTAAFRLLFEIKEARKAK